MKKAIVVGAALALAGVGAFVALRREAAEPPATDAGNGRPVKAVKGAGLRPRPAQGPGGKAAGGRRVAAPASDDDLSAADRRLDDAVQEALDAEDFARTCDAARRAGKSANAEVRLQAVEALGWFGQKVLVDLVPFMGDADADVAAAAANAWEFGLMEVDDAEFKYAASHAALKTVADPDALSMIGAQFASAATERIDAAEGEEAKRLRVQAVQALVDLMESPGGAKRGEVARELYEEITGQRWLGLDEAERYLRDPENYEPPEDASPTGAGG